MIGPAVAGVLVAAVGSGWVFLCNAASFVAVLAALALLRTRELHVKPRAGRSRGSLVEGLRYAWNRPDLRALLAMVFLFGTFGLNFPIFISTMSVTVFHAGASQFGLLTSIMAIGTVAGALLSARRETPRLSVVLVGSGVFGAGLIGLALVVIGVAAQTTTTTANSTLQLSTDPVMRGRVMALFLAIALGGTPLGAPIVGWVADKFGPRWSLGVGAAGGLGAALIGLHYLWTYRHLRLRLAAGWPRLTMDTPGAASGPGPEALVPGLATQAVK